MRPESFDSRQCIGTVTVSGFGSQSLFSIYGSIKSRYVTDVLPLLPLLPPVNCSQGGLPSARFTSGVTLTIYGR